MAEYVVCTTEMVVVVASVAARISKLLRSNVSFKFMPICGN